jgi:putative RNA 2'-phosphotransferase
MLDEVVFTNDKSRFGYSSDGQFIRANQGHSIPVELSLLPQVPPHFLFHGTATRLLTPIRVEGLRKMTRQHVHLSSDSETARRVGARHGIPAVLTIRALDLHATGTHFLLSRNGVWLADHVPSTYIEGL